MRLSVIVPAYNEGRALRGTLTRLGEAVRLAGIPVEVLVVDNGSTDDTTEVATACGARVVAEPRRGVARARNTGAAAARAQVLVFMDADVLLPERALARIADTRWVEVAVNDSRMQHPSTLSG